MNNGSSQKPVPAPTGDQLRRAGQIYDDWELHYYQLLLFHEPALTSPGEYGRPFAVRMTQKLNLEIVPQQALEYTFTVSPAESQEDLETLDASVLEKCQMILDAIFQRKQKPHPQACCGLAKRRKCNCAYSFECLLHGKRCIGSHE